MKVRTVRVEAEAVTSKVTEFVGKNRKPGCPNLDLWFGPLLFSKELFFLSRQPFGIWGNNRTLDFSNCH